MANMGDIATRQWNEQAKKVKEQRGEEIDDLGNKLSELEAYRRSFEPKLDFDGNGKVKEPDVPEGSAKFFWKEFPTECRNCGQKRARGRGWMFVGMTPEGEMHIFCNVDCCDEWELVGDNTNARRAAIMAQKARRENE